MSPQTEHDIYSDTGGWTNVHQSADEWELSLGRAALVHAKIPVRLQPAAPDSDTRRMALLVPLEYEEQALDILLRVVQAVDHRASPIDATHDDSAAQAETPLVRATPTDSPTRTVAERQGVGEILYRQGFGYELRVGPEPYAVVLEEDWDEFTDLSAQRTEFWIHIRKEYPKLDQWLRAEKKLGDFLRLVEATYQGPLAVDTPSDFLRGALWMAAAIAAVALLLTLVRWLQGPAPPVTG